MPDDELEVEPTTAPSSEETKQPEETEVKSEVSEDVKTPEEKSEEPKEAPVVPYERFKKVNDQMKAYRELLEAKKEEAPIAKREEVQTEEQAEQIVRRIAREEASRIKKSQDSAIELNSVMSAHPDFIQYKDQVKEMITQNPNLGWTEAYKLAKFDAIEAEAQERGKQEAYKKIEQKKKANVEPAKKATVRVTGADIDPLAKGPDGKYLYSLKELEEVLPK